MRQNDDVKIQNEEIQAKKLKKDVEEILTEENYPVYRKLFLITQEDIEDEFAENKLPMMDVPDPISYLFQLAEDVRIKKIIMDGFQFFLHEPVLLLADQ